jgi:hypothetical protein
VCGAPVDPERDTRSPAGLLAHQTCLRRWVDAVLDALAAVAGGTHTFTLDEVEGVIRPVGIEPDPHPARPSDNGPNDIPGDVTPEARR